MNPFGNPNPRFSAGLAVALMPTRNFAQERADKAANLQLMQMEQQQAAQAAEEKRTALASVQNTLSLVDQQDFLAPDKARLNLNLTEPFRQQVEKEITDDYGGDVTRYGRERGDYLAKQFAKQLLAHPLRQQALQTKANYALAKDAEAKGKLIVGDFDKDYLDYMQGRTDRLVFRGAYDAPKNVWDYFDKNHSTKGQYGQTTVVNGKLQQRAFEVTRDDLYGHLLSEGLSPAEAQDYMRRVNYQGGRTWKMDSQSPWDAAEQAQQNAFRQQALNYQGQGLAIQREGMSLERQRTNAEVSLKDAQAQKAQAEAKGGSTGSAGIVQHIWAPDPKNLQEVKISSQPLLLNGRTVKRGPGVGGPVGEAMVKSLGIESAIPPLLDGGYDKEGRPIQKPGVIASNLMSVTDLRGRRHRNPDGTVIQFQQVDTNHIYYVPAGKEGSGAAENRVPHLMGTAIIDKKPVQVLLPMPYSPLAANQMGSISATNNSDEKRAQTVISTPAETGSRSPLSGLIPSRAQQLRAQELRSFLLGPNP
ncbi:hypothetical protein J2I47_25640 [Fibrella sp. HMF5335]|uniref:Uncharacterized protein n=1 Tax=Fibrella rubiginis TaxID=2817060 RepID=A0A939K5X4_9BACT|nr:hypothetical protein [Fibrella rubiginis]MBO0939954.1 hypothetical protein [Fibrella rubiginis]